jgi:hypothetical protein
LRKGKSWGSEAGKYLGSDLCYEHRKEVRGFNAYDRNSDSNIRKASWEASIATSILPK